MPMKQYASCGTELSPDLPSQMCPACLLESGMSENFANPSADGTRAGATDAGRSFAHYELLNEIARGGQGVVYRARDTTLNREVALKMLPFGPWTTEGHLNRFRTEARVTAELDHPAIVPIYEISEWNGQHYFAMKLIDGQSLNRVSATTWTEQQAAGIVMELAQAVEHAHSRGVLHRDIKPGNVLLDTQGRPHITDFGLAKLMVTDSALTQTRELLGTPSFVSPEMAQGNAALVSPATDVYGLGAVLYQLLTGAPPFAGGTTLETIRQVVEQEPRRPRLWRPKLDRDLELICLKCLEKDPTRRYPTAAALAHDLERWLHHEPIQVRRANVFYRLRKFSRRHAAALAMIAILLAAAAIVTTVMRRPALPAPRSLAVVFKSGNPESHYLTTEFSRNLIHALGTLPGVNVAPRGEILKWEQGTARPEDVGRAIGVPVVLTGTLRQSGDEVELQAELIDVASHSALWSRTLKEKMSAAAELQHLMVRIVATKLGIELSAKNRHELRRLLTTDPEAWTHYLRARQHRDTFSEPEMLAAVDEFEQAIAHDPKFAQAYAGLAGAHFELGYTFRDPMVHLPKAKHYVKEALKLDETLVEAIITDGVVKFFYDWDWTAAGEAVRRAVLLDPSELENHACYLHSLESVGRADEAIKMVQLAFARHPRSIAIQCELGCAAYYAGSYELAVSSWRDALKSDPENAYIHWGLGRALAQQGKYAEAADIFAAGQTKPGGDWTGITTEIAYVRGREHRREDALALVAQLRSRMKTEFVDPYLFAMAYAGLDEADEVFRYLGLAVKGRSGWIPSLPVDPKFAGLRSDPRYAPLLASLKTPPREI
ncbi:MAG: protein kinase [Opitutus sp.]